MTTPSDESDTIGWAVALHLGAEALAAVGPPRTSNPRHSLPFYLLVGFSLENGLKATLEFKKLDPKIGKWTHSHKLAELLDLAQGVGFRPDPIAIAFIQRFSPYHEQFQFRYPAKSGTVELPDAEIVVQLVEDTLRRAFDFIGGRARL